MALTRPWRIYRRMQDSALAVGVLVYTAAAVDAWRVLALTARAKTALLALFPAGYLGLTLLACLTIPALRRALRAHLWTSYRTGFGQSAISVLSGLGLLILVAGLIVLQVHGVARGGRSPGGAFAGYGAGVGLLLAQAVLVRRIERDPAFRPLIEA